MKSLMNVLVLFLVCATVRVFGQETFAPLITDDTILFVHVDLRKIEIDTIKTQAEKITEDLLKQLSFDNDSLKSTIKELKNEFEKLNKIIHPSYETMTKKLGIHEFAILFDIELVEKINCSVLVVSWKNKTEADLKVLRSIFPDDWRDVSLITSGDFLFIPFHRSFNLNEKIHAGFATWFEAIKPSKKSPLHQGLQVLGQDEIKIVMTLPPKLTEEFLHHTAISSGLQELLLFALQKIEWAAASFSINVSPSDKKTNDDVILTIKTTKQTDATQLRGMLEFAIDFVIHRFKISHDDDVKSNNSFFEISPFFYEFLKGAIRTFLPDVEGDKLVFRLKDKNSGVTKHKISVVGGAVVTLFLPIIQASREPAQQMACATNLKHIALALHTYHDIHNTFPPLYTVDKDGKPLHSWRVLILPFLEQTALYEKIRHNESWDSEYNKQFHNIVIDIYRCSANPKAQKNGLCCYAVIAGEVFLPAEKIAQNGIGMTGTSSEKITDGMSNTLALVEVKEPFCWMNPTVDITLGDLIKGTNENGRIGSFHKDGFNAAFFDGRVNFLSNSISKEILQAIGTYNEEANKINTTTSPND
jgi:hypothetical protein